MENSSVDPKRDYSWQKEKNTNYLGTTIVLQSYPAKNGHCKQNQQKLQEFSRKERVVGICEISRDSYRQGT